MLRRESSIDYLWKHLHDRRAQKLSEVQISYSHRVYTCTRERSF
jgi:hypothetical protein